MSQFFRVKFTHQPHYQGFTVCTYHVRQFGGPHVEIVEVAAADLLPLPAHLAAVGHGHCHSCNREKPLNEVPKPRIAFG